MKKIELRIDKRKMTFVGLAALVTAVVLVSGTYAASLMTTGEGSTEFNPGGRLHEDFNFPSSGNKDVYVENFSDKPIFARIRFDEYMELEKDGGTKLDPAADQAKLDTWTTYLWEREKKIEADGGTVAMEEETSVFRKYVLWNQDADGSNYEADTVKYYMPTFNKNKDSVQAEINGTLEGKDGQAYGDYVNYTVSSRVTDFAVYDADSNDADEIVSLPKGITTDDILAELTNTAGDDWNHSKLLDDGFHQIEVGTQTFPVTVTKDADNDSKVASVMVTFNSETNGAVEIKKETHTAKATLSGGTIMSMAKWMDSDGNNSQPGDYWVYDEDGWVYWANPIPAGEATSLLLDRIVVRDGADIGEGYYYGLNVVAQFADDAGWGETENSYNTVTNTGGKTTVTKGSGTGFYAKDNGGMTENGKKLLDAVKDSLNN